MLGLQSESLFDNKQASTIFGKAKEDNKSKEIFPPKPEVSILSSISANLNSELFSESFNNNQSSLVNLCKDTKTGFNKLFSSEPNLPKNVETQPVLPEPKLLQNIQNSVLPDSSNFITGPNLNVQKQNEVKKEEPKEVQDTTKKQELISVDKNSIGLNPIKDKLTKSAQNYWSLRSKISEMSENSKNKVIIEKVMTEINLVINQLSTEEDVNKSAESINKVLAELTKLRNKDMYIFTLDYICKRLVFKSEKYKDEPKRNFLIFSKMMTLVSVNNSLVADFFIQILCYKCPYVIPAIYNSSHFKDPKELKKRLGFSSEDESVVDFMNNMECYSYLYFSFLSMNKKYLPVIQEYLTCLETSSVEYPLSATLKAFLNSLGAYIKEKVTSGQDRTKAIVSKFVKAFEEIKNKKTTQNQVKSLITSNVHFCKTYMKNIMDNKPTEMYMKDK